MHRKVGELLILGFKGPTVPTWLVDFEKSWGLGGVILFDYDYQTKKYENNVRSPEQVKDLCASLSRLASRPLICIDQEGGKVRRLKESLGFAPLPSQKEMAKTAAAPRAEIWNRACAEMRNLGIHLNLAPVVDIDFNPKNPDIGAIERSFSAEAAVVAENTALLARCAKDAGLGLCLKHFPGLGGATTNSHLEYTDISDTLDEAQLTLFYTLAEKIPAHAMLLCHGIVKQWDPHHPVSMSSFAIEQIRSHLPDALLISDDLQMQALQLQFSTANACLQGIGAGLDLLIIGNNLKDEQALSDSIARSLDERAQRDDLFARRVDSAMRRIWNSKETLVS